MGWGGLVVGEGERCVEGERVGGAYQARMNHVQDSTREKHERTTQYISHGVSCAGSDVRSAL